MGGSTVRTSSPGFAARTGRASPLAIHTVIDLRYSWEIESDGRIPATAGVAYPSIEQGRTTKPALTAASIRCPSVRSATPRWRLTAWQSCVKLSSCSQLPAARPWWPPAGEPSFITFETRCVAIRPRSCS
jgi:hypothetical protein